MDHCRRRCSRDGGATACRGEATADPAPAAVPGLSPHLRLDDSAAGGARTHGAALRMTSARSGATRARRAPMRCRASSRSSRSPGARAVSARSLAGCGRRSTTSATSTLASKARPTCAAGWRSSCRRSRCGWRSFPAPSGHTRRRPAPARARPQASPEPLYRRGAAPAAGRTWSSSRP